MAPPVYILQYFYKFRDPKTSKYPSLSSNTGICRLCLTQKDLIQLSCIHRFCDSCLKFRLKSQIFQNLKNGLDSLSQLNCWWCLTPINIDIISKTITQNELSILQKKSGIYERSLWVYCNICYRDYPVSYIVTLDCNHKFDVNCLVAYLSSLITEKKVAREDLHCPECLTDIHPEIIKENCPKEIYEKYIGFFLQVYQPDDLSLRAVPCQHCNNLVEVPKDTELIRCPKCETISCQHCDQLHDEGLCKMNYFKKNVKDVNDKRCPNCGERVFKVDGCNFVKCPWPNCKNSYFCYLCLVPLMEKEHYTHYPEGAYHEICDTLNNIQLSS